MVQHLPSELFLPPLPSFKVPVPPPLVDPQEEPTVAVCFNREWLPYVLGALQQLVLPTTWQGTSEEKNLTVQRAQTLLAAVGTEQCNIAPFWDDDDGDDATGNEPQPSDFPWYENLADFVVTAFLAIAFEPNAAVQFVTTARRLRLWFRRRDWGAIVRILIDNEEVGMIDTYSPVSDIVEFAYDIPETSQQPDWRLRIEHTGTANVSATPIAQGFSMEVIRKRLQWSQQEETMLRPNPQNLCELQQLIAGNWITVFDASTCGAQGEQGEPGVSARQPALGSEPSGEDCTRIYWYYADDPPQQFDLATVCDGTCEEDCAEPNTTCQQAAGFVWAYVQDHLFPAWIQIAQCAQTECPIVDELGDIFAVYNFGETQPALWQTVVTNLYDIEVAVPETIQGWIDQFEADFLPLLHEFLYCSWTDQTTNLTEATIAAFRALVQAQGQAEGDDSFFANLFAFLEASATVLLQIYQFVVGEGFFNVPSYVCAEIDCGWQFEMDLSTQDFAQYIEAGEDSACRPLAAYLTDVGWVSKLAGEGQCPGADPCQDCAVLSLRVNLPQVVGTIWQSVEMEYHVVTTIEGSNFSVNDDATWSELLPLNQTEGSLISHTWTALFQPSDRLLIAYSPIYLDLGGNDAGFALKRILLKGEGTNPF